MQLQIWDPRKEENYTLDDCETKKKFTSLDKGLFVIEAIGLNLSSDTGEFIFKNLLKDTQTKFIAAIIQPWEKEKRFREVLDETFNVDYTLVNYFTRFRNDEMHVNKFIESREKLGNYESGEWIIVGSSVKVVLSRDEVMNGFSKLLDRIEDFEFLIYMAEMQQCFIIFKSFKKVDYLISRLNPEFQPL